MSELTPLNHLSEICDKQVGRFNIETLRAVKIQVFDAEEVRQKIGEIKQVLAVDLGGSKASSALITIDHDFRIRQSEILTLQSRDGKGYLEFLLEISKLAQELSLPVGISTTGVVKGTRLVNTTYLKKFKEDLETCNGDLSRLSPAFKSVSNDAIAGSMAGYVEALRQFPNTTQALYLVNGSGLGAAVIKDNDIWAMEPGHVEVLDDLNLFRRKSICSLTGKQTSCLHLITSGIGLENTYFEKTGEKVTGVELAERFMRGDGHAIDLLRVSASMVAVAVEGIMSTFDMLRHSQDTAIILHGGLFNAQGYADLAEKNLQERLGFKPQLIFTKDTGRNMCLDGAALAALQS